MMDQRGLKHVGVSCFVNRYCELNDDCVHVLVTSVEIMCNNSINGPSDRTVALGSTQPLTEMSTRSISWG